MNAIIILFEMELSTSWIVIFEASCREFPVGSGIPHVFYPAWDWTIPWKSMLNTQSQVPIPTRTWSFICISALFLDGWWRNTSEIQPKSTGKWVFTRFFWSERILAEWKWPVFFGNALCMFVTILYVCEMSMVSPCKPWEQDVLYLIDWIWFLIPDLLFFCWLVVWNILYFSIYWE